MTLSRQKTRARRWLAACSVLVLVMVAGLIPATSASAAKPSRMVLDWNEYAVNTIGNAPSNTTFPGLGQPPPLGPIHLAMVHGAVYDAVNAIDRKHDPYLQLSGLPAGRARASKEAAVATAAHHVLINLPAVPAMTQAVRDNLDLLYQRSLAQIRNNRRKTEGIRIGSIAAQAMLAERATDGRFVGSATWPTSDDIGKWRPVATANANVFAWIATVSPFTLNNPGQFRTAGPLPLGSTAYAAEFNEVKSLGSNVVPSARTTDQTNLAHFVSASPVGIMNGLLRQVAGARGLTTSDQARLFAQSSISAADALIGCWDDKKHWNFWRPQTAIRAVDDGNGTTVSDPNWTSLFQNPGYPDHPSGYNCFTGSMMETAKAFFGTDVYTFSLTSPGTNPPTTTTTRSYTRFSQVTADAIEGRILTGFHFRTPDVQGAQLGQNVARWVAANYFGRAH